MTVRSFTYWEDLTIQLMNVLPFARDEGAGVRVAWMHEKPIVAATMDVPYGLVEEVFEK